MAQPLLSFATVVRNGAATIGETIASVAAQKTPETEYVIVDGLSTDNTLDVVRAAGAAVDSLVSEKDSGIYDAMNKAIARTSGRYIWLINADDQIRPGAVERVLAALRQTPEPELIYGELEVWDPDLNTSLIYPATLSNLARVPRANHPSTIVARALYDRIGPYDCRYRLAADYDFLIRAVKANARVTLIHEPLSRFRTGGSCANIRMNGELRDIQTAHYSALRGNLTYWEMSARRQASRFLNLFRSNK